MWFMIHPSRNSALWAAPSRRESKLPLKTANQKSTTTKFSPMDEEKAHSVLVTEENPALATLERSWLTRRYSNEDGIGMMSSLHEAGDALVAVAQLSDSGTIVLGS